MNLFKFIPSATLVVVLIVAILRDLAQASAPMKEFRQHNNILKFSVEENKPPNTFVAQIRSNDQQIPHMILPWPSKTTEREIRQALSYNSTTGELYTLTPLDREHRDQYYFVAITKEPFAEIKCSVEVLDVNDNAPKFQTPNPNDTHIVIDIPEGQSGYRHKLPMAYDYDSPQYGIKEFRITSGNTPSGTFLLVESGAPTHSTSLGLEDQSSSMLASDNPQLRKQLDQESNVLVPSQSTQQSSGATPQQSTTPATKSFYIDLEANVPLDRENQSSYTLQVEAIDGGSPAMFGRLVVTVNVLDINDNDPLFPPKSINNPYEISIPENTTKASLIYTVKAYDVDLGPNGQVTYFIKRVIPSSQQQIANSSDYNSNGSNEVPTNRNVKPRGQQQQQPQMQSANKLSPTGSQRPNMDFADMHNYKIRSQQEQPLFEMDPKKGEIYLVGQLDYEQDQMHELIIEARDNGKPSRNSTVTIKVFVIDTKDETPSYSRGGEDGRRLASSNGLNGNTTYSALPQSSIDPHQVDFIDDLRWNLNLSQMNSSMLFVIVFAAVVAVAFTVCLVKMKSRQPESDYNDTAGLTSPSNNGQAKTSPNHSTSNIDHANGLINDSLHHHHHDRLSRRGPNMGGSFNEQNIGKTSGYDSSSNHYQITYPTHHQRPRHHSSSSRHLLPDLAPDSHQIPSAAALLQEIGGSRGGTMTLSNNPHLSHHQHLLNQSGHHHSLDHHHNQFAGGTLANSLAYAHSQATLLHPAHHLHNNHHHHHHHHHQSTHHLSHPLNSSGHLMKGGTMNSVGTQNSAHHHQVSSSPMPVTPTTIHSSMQQVAMQHDPSNPHNPRSASLMPPLPQIGQIQPTSASHLTSGNVFSYPPSHGPGSTLGCFPDGNHHLGGSGGLNDTPGSTMDSCSSAAGASASTPPPLDRWTDLGVPAQLVSTQDWCGTYNWDQLEEWTPEYHTVLPLIQSGEISATNY